MSKYAILLVTSVGFLLNTFSAHAQPLTFSNPNAATNPPLNRKALAPDQFRQAVQAQAVQNREDLSARALKNAKPLPANTPAAFKPQPHETVNTPPPPHAPSYAPPSPSINQSPAPTSSDLMKSTAPQNNTVPAEDKPPAAKNYTGFGPNTNNTTNGGSKSTSSAGWNINY